MIRTLQIIWLLPMTVLVWVIYILPLWLIWRDLKFVRWAKYGVAEFILAERALEAWHARLWRDWAGWGGPCCFVWKGDPHAVMSRTRLHELEHCRQQFVWGPLFYPVYLLASVWIWLAGPADKNAYYDNPFERAARKAAGQRVDIPPAHWRDGKGDRWPWW